MTQQPSRSFQRRTTIGQAARRWLRLAAGIAVVTLVSGCSSLLSEPIGIGSDRDALKQSPCACFELPQHYDGWWDA